ncbi:hypothetical protein Pan44_53260 [Caulifigura coniformis]|uniref:Uncharacterized protein n=1 Tax=Caulifigura coniformis TaxID=2527983 RepID=A0A517SMB9_9PLAN|nr:hypothetical protein [Caulifigura coniformis]QDT57258.1 hypothetical protein Pan44_53260 [Caulifigura coniformis]
MEKPELITLIDVAPGSIVIHTASDEATATDQRAVDVFTNAAVQAMAAGLPVFLVKNGEPKRLVQISIHDKAALSDDDAEE